MTEEKDLNAFNISWRIMFGEEYARKVDPNKPEFQPYLKAIERKKLNAIKSWISQGGEYLINDMAEDIKRKILLCVGKNRTTEEGRTESLLLLDDIKRDLTFLFKIENAINSPE